MLMKRIIIICAAAVLVLAIAGYGVFLSLHKPADGMSSAEADMSEQTAATAPDTAAQQPAAAQATELDAALRQAAELKRFTFVTFHQGNDAAGAQMITEVKSAVESKLSSRAIFVSVDASEPVNRGVLSRYGADRSPLPLTLVIAANGAVTAGYPQQIPSAVKDSGFAEALAAPGMADVLKALQNGSLVAVCFQNAKTKFNAESRAAADGLKALQQFAGKVEVVVIDPANPDEAMLLKVCSVDVAMSSAQLVVIAPPGSIAGRFDGAVTTEAVAQSLAQPRGRS